MIKVIVEMNNGVINHIYTNENPDIHRVCVYIIDEDSSKEQVKEADFEKGDCYCIY